jgi:hypothetical protein
MDYRRIAAGAALAAGAAVSGTQVSAQQLHTYVSGLGNDTSATCSQTAPCQTFAGALAKTASGGEIDCLDSGGYGSVTITIPLVIDCEAATGGILVSGSNGVLVSVAGGAVVLKGLDINGFGPTGHSRNGIQITQGTVTIDHCLITNFGGVNGADGHGIYVFNTAPVALTVSHTLIANNAGGGIWVKHFSTGANDIEVTFSDVHAAGNGFGLVFDGTGLGGTGRIYGSVTDSAIDNSVHNGVTVSNGAASNISIKLENVQVTGGVYGLVAGGANAGMIVGHAKVIGNTTGLATLNGGLLYSYGNNRVNGNGIDGAFSAVIPTK